MYSKFFGLSGMPFEERADTHYYYPVSSTEEALAFLEYESKYGRSLASIVGDAGTGKTLLIRSMLMRYEPNDQVVVLTWAKGSQAHLVREVCKVFGVTLPTSYSRSRGLARLRRHLKRLGKNDRRAVLFIDQAENLNADDVSQLNALTELQYGDHRLLAIVLVGQPQIRTTLSAPAFASLHQHFSGERVLDPFTLRQTQEYINHRLNIAGAGNAEIFDGVAVDLIHKASRGLPRLINKIANEAMVSAYGKSEKIVSTATATEVVKSWNGGSILPSGDQETSDIAVLQAQPPMNTPVTTPVSMPADDVPDVDDESLMQLQAEVERFEAESVRGMREDMREVGCDIPQEPEAKASPGTAWPAAQPLCSAEGAAGAAMPGYVMRESPALGKMIEDAQVLLEKLQRGFARAERIHIASEAHLMQTTAVERHLESLTEQAQALGTELSQVIQRGNQDSRRIRTELSQELDVSRGLVQDIRAEIDTASDAGIEARHVHELLESACRKGTEVESSLKEFAARLADQADAVQERITTAMSGTETVHVAHEKAARLAKTIDVAAVEYQKQMRAARDEVAEKISGLSAAMETARLAQQQMTESAEDTVAKTVEQILRRSEDAIAQIEDRAKQNISRFEQRSQDSIAQFEDRSAQTMAQVERQSKDAIAQMEAQSQKTAAQIERQGGDVLAQIEEQSQATVGHVERQSKETMAQIERRTEQTTALFERRSEDTIQQFEQRL
ncbi:MAG: ExeA family protein, partial [Planctomycetota bacterium]